MWENRFLPSTLRNKRVKWPWITLQGCRSKIHSLGGLDNRNFFSQGFGGWKFKIKVPARLVPPEAPVLGFQTASLTASSHGHGLLLPGVSLSCKDTSISD